MLLLLSLLLLKITNNFKRDELEDDIASQHCRPLLLFLFSLFYGFDVFLLLLFKIINNYNQDELEEDIDWFTVLQAVHDVVLLSLILIIMKITRMSSRRTSCFTASPAVIIVHVFCGSIVLFLLLLFRFCSRSPTCITRMSSRRTSCFTASRAISSSWFLFFSPPLSYRCVKVLIWITTKKKKIKRNCIHDNKNSMWYCVYEKPCSSTLARLFGGWRLLSCLPPSSSSS